MSLVGRLEDLALADIFQIISLSKKTGTLVLKGKAGAAVIVFKNGQIIQAATDNLRDTLGNTLISGGLITEQDLARALETQRKGPGSGRRLGQILVDQGALSEYHLGETIREQIENMILSLLGWEEGFFNFDLGDVAPSDKIEVVTQEFLLRAGINPEYLLMESARVSDERKRGTRAKIKASGPPAKGAVTEFSELLGDVGSAPGTAPREERAAAPRPGELTTLKAMFEELRFPAATAEVTLLVLRYASEIVNRAVLFMVTRNEVRGLGQFGIELREGSPDQRVRQIRLPVSETTIFSDVIAESRSRTGHFSDSAWDAYLIKELGEDEPGAFFLVPMVSNGRVAAILYGDNVPDNKPLPDITGLEIFIHQAGLAMEKALLERRVMELGKQANK